MLVYYDQGGTEVTPCYDHVHIFKHDQIYGDKLQYLGSQDQDYFLKLFLDKSDHPWYEAGRRMCEVAIGS